MTALDWTILPNGKSAVRPIRQGDRVACALATMQKITACDASVAVVREKTDRSVCPRHLAEYVLKSAGMGNRWGLNLREVVTAQAKQTLVEMYAGEFEVLMTEGMAEAQESAFGMLPDELRKAVTA